MNIELMEKKLYQACLKGDVQMLEALMREDELTLARISLSSCINQRPLHLACMLGHFEFAKSLISYKPDFTSWLDSQGRSPLHLASANGYANIVALLLQHDRKMCQVCDEDGRTPLHMAVMNGHYETVRELNKVNYDDGQEGTALHLCVIYNRLNIFILILESNVQDLSNILNIKNDQGNTILHSATALKRVQIIKYLVMDRGEAVDVNAVNVNGLTALDMIEQMPKDAKTMEIKELLVSAGTWRAKETKGGATREVSEEEVTAAEAVPDHNSKWVKTLIKNSGIFQKKEEKVDKTLLVAASVIAAMSYQAAISPPGGVAGLDAQEGKYLKEYSLYPGTSLIAYFDRPGSDRFWIANTISYMASLSVIFLYVNSAGLKRKFIIWLIRLAMWITLTSMTLAYMSAVQAISIFTDIAILVLSVGLYSWIGLISLSGLVVFYRFLRHVVGPFILVRIRWATKKKDTTDQAEVAARIPNTANVDESSTCTSKKIEIIDV